MPHYKDGSEAKVGDNVKGYGYNVKHPDGTQKLIHGVVIGIVPDSQSCNIRVAHITTHKLPQSFEYPTAELFHQVGVLTTIGNESCGATVSLEYGECSSFEKI